MVERNRAGIGSKEVSMPVLWRKVSRHVEAGPRMVSWLEGYVIPSMGAGEVGNGVKVWFLDRDDVVSGWVKALEEGLVDRIASVEVILYEGERLPLF